MRHRHGEGFDILLSVTVHATQRKKQKLTELEIAMLKNMEYIVSFEGRTFSYKDFRRFETNDRYYAVSHGTCRNKFSKFVKMGINQVRIQLQGFILYTPRTPNWSKTR